MSELIPVHEAEQRIRSSLPSFGTEQVPIDRAAGRVLRQAVRAECDQPPFDRVMMDGIAIALGDGSRRTFTVRGRQLAGMHGQSLDDPSGCIEVTTGAVLPAGCDCVVPVEQCRRDGDRVELVAGWQPQPRQFIHPRGSDCRQGDELLAPGMRLRAPELAVLAANGLDRVEVARMPAVAIVATGDELGEVDQQPLAEGQIRRSNDRALAAALHGRGFDDVLLTRVPDDLAATTQTLASLLASRQVLVLSGGVSVGQRDFVPAALRELGVTQVLHRIAQRPGKPMWFGIGPQRQIVFALPGNPVSALVCAVRYLLPALEQAVGLPGVGGEPVVLAASANTSPTLTCFIPVRVHHDEAGRTLAVPVPAPTSGDFSGLPRTDGVVELPPSGNPAAAGTVAPLYRW
ncbi:molybdopterin molybdotransferase MoeA [Dyella lutea]|uniref:Molybdopterin molybdenumtransferase n=1 Tax=Dyella lutea TaxID=2950441 RepID=A0ABT1FD90_9GAMM|nr:molybdopterin molybdotransferase MoeA [Dyella lutea]MCP1375325.1 molybdopterin molybdotransferase MoeA [Dyella lutea]